MYLYVSLGGSKIYNISLKFASILELLRPTR